MRGRVAALAVVGAILLIAVPVALAGTDGMYRGTTSQGLKVQVLVSDTQVQRLNIPWKATDCLPDDGYTIKLRRFLWTNDEDGAIEMDGDRFSDSGKVTIDHARISARMGGKFVTTKRIVGMQRISVRTKDKFGVHRCKLKMKWSATWDKP